MDRRRPVKPLQTTEMYLREGILLTGNRSLSRSEIFVPKGKRWVLADYPTERQDQAKKFIQKKTACTLTGGNGTRKTSFARATIIEFLLTTEWYEEWCLKRDPEEGEESGWIFRQPTISWVDWYDLCTEASRQAAFDEDADDLIGWYRRCDLLIIDDIGEQRTQTRFDTVEDIIKKRIDNNQKTLVTTNLKHEEMERSLGRRVTDRILEYVVVMDGESSREKDIA